jgi:predicted DNA-binding transcriptional regulator AlpA
MIVRPSSETVAPELLTLKQAAELCAVSDRTLSTWATSGISPAPVKIGKGTVRYSRPEYPSWIAGACTPVGALTPALSQGDRKEGIDHG